MSTDDLYFKPNPGYAAGQLSAALATLESHPDEAVRTRATEKIRRWQQVVSGMKKGTLAVGSRTPVANTPAWVTLEVAHGGFATGSFLAAGPLRPHERAWLDAMGVGAVSETEGRARLNQAFASEEGLRLLDAMLASGRFRVDVPEEGAMLAVALLITRGHATLALDVLDAIGGFADKLRFYPRPAEEAVASQALVHVTTVKDTAASLAAMKTRPQIAKMTETLRHWNPLYDDAVSLFLETVEGEAPSLKKDAAGALVRRADGNAVVEGGWPCRSYPVGWDGRARYLLSTFEKRRASHSLVKKVEKPSENFDRLRRVMAVIVKSPARLTGRQVGEVRAALAGYVARHGLPSGAARAAVREVQRTVAGLPSMVDYARVLERRLKPFGKADVLPSFDAVAGALTADEAASLSVTEGAAMPDDLVVRTHRAVDATVEEHIARGTITSGELLAILLPQITAHVQAAAFDDPAARSLYGALYTAFRRRRSLLLLNLESQVRFEELPWVSALAVFRKAPPVVSSLGETSSTGAVTAKALKKAAKKAAKKSEPDPKQGNPAAMQTLREVSALVLGAFPETIVPNKLLSELRSLVESAQVALPLTEELAADIFMGSFSMTFLRAAQLAARLLKGTAYARYYDVPCEAIGAMKGGEEKWGVAIAADLATLCESRAERFAQKKRKGWSVANNGVVIEQVQILTTHNLAALWEVCDLQAVLGARLPSMAKTCLDFVFRQLQMTVPDGHTRLITLKNSAYAWRQMLFFLSMATEDERAAWTAWSYERFCEQDEVFRLLFVPAMEGLWQVLRGGVVEGTGRVFLGWSLGRHWVSG